MDNNDENTPERTAEQVFELLVDQAYLILMENDSFMLSDVYSVLGNATLKLDPDFDVDLLSSRCKMIVEALVVKYCQ